MNEHNADTVTLLLDNDTTIKCDILTILSVEERRYIALLAPEAEDGNRMVYLYRYLESPDGEPQIENIVEDEEYEQVADAYDEWLDTIEFEAPDSDEPDAAY